MRAPHWVHGRQGPPHVKTATGTMTVYGMDGREAGAKTVPGMDGRKKIATKTVHGVHGMGMESRSSGKELWT